jgi:hypothetical protein
MNRVPDSPKDYICTKFGQNPLKDVDSRVFTRMLRSKILTRWHWPWKSIGFQTLLRTKYVPSLVKIHYSCFVLCIIVGDLIFVDFIFYYPLANEVAKGYSNASVCPSVTSLWPLESSPFNGFWPNLVHT